MREFSLDEILGDDPLGLLSEPKLTAASPDKDERLLESFEEINTFVQKRAREPQRSSDMYERTLHVRLQALRQHPEKMEHLKPYDRFHLLQTVCINSIDDILNDDVFGLLGGGDEDIFALKNIPKKSDIAQPDYIAARKACKDFEQYEPLFKEVHHDLKTGKRSLAKFEKEQEIYEKEFYILKEVLVYIASKGHLVKKNKKTNTRLHCIYENGTESDVLMRSLSRELYRDGKRVSRHENKLLENLQTIGEKDEQSGYIYILESLSRDDTIATIKNLYKIGYATTAVKERIKNAINEPTYLMAPVRIVAVYETYNMNTQKFEQLIHRFFGKVCLNVDIFGADGARYTPREWFIVPLEVIEQAIELIISGEIVSYRYDAQNEALVLA